MEELKESVAVASQEYEKAKGVQQTLGVIRVIEGLFNAMQLASYPIRTHDAIVAGLQFLSQFHSQLVGQLPPGLVDEMRKAASQPAPAAEAPKAEVANEQPANA